MPALKIDTEFPEIAKCVEGVLRSLGGKARLSLIISEVTDYCNIEDDEQFGGIGFAVIVTLELRRQFNRCDQEPGDWWTIDEDAPRLSER